MDTIPKSFIGIIILIMTVFATIGIVEAQTDGESARRYHDSIKQEIEASDLNGNVIDKCGQSAMEKGYTLIVRVRCADNTVKKITYDADNGTITGGPAKDILGAKSVDIELDYRIKLPVFKHIYKKQLHDVA